MFSETGFQIFNSFFQNFSAFGSCAFTDYSTQLSQLRQLTTTLVLILSQHL